MRNAISSSCANLASSARSRSSKVVMSARSPVHGLAAAFAPRDRAGRCAVQSPSRPRGQQSRNLAAGTRSRSGDALREERQLGLRARFVGSDRILPRERQADLVEPLDQAMLAERVDVEAEAVLELRGDRL